jgi:hypothetical protein
MNADIEDQILRLAKLDIDGILWLLEIENFEEPRMVCVYCTGKLGSPVTTLFGKVAFLIITA